VPDCARELWGGSDAQPHDVPARRVVVNVHQAFSQAESAPMGIGIAVVIPTLGRPSLERAVRSVVRQTVGPEAIIIVANGREQLSPDRVGGLEQLGDGVSLVVVSLPPFSGPSICRNVGAWVSGSEYVAFLDDDDEFAPNYLELMAGEVAKDQPDLLYGAKVWRKPDGTIRREKRLHTVPQERWLEALYRQENHGFGGQNVVVRRDAFFEIGGFPVDLPSGEDRALAMAALRAGKEFIYVDAAEVSCHDPEGYRAKERSDKWLTNLKIIRDYWGDVSWRSRVRSLWRVFRSLIRS
jgi:glycosyltransferase involved in cell wall biosynthesis